MLGIAERLCTDKGLDWAFCDTDSFAIAKPDDIEQCEFIEQAQSICDWFSALNPYEKKGSNIQNRRRELPYCGVRRRAKFRATLLPLHFGEALRPIQYRKCRRNHHSQGLGVRARAIPRALWSRRRSEFNSRPLVDLNTIGVERWHYDLWHSIIRAVLDGHADQVDLSYHDGLIRPAASRYGATTPALLNWFKLHNNERAYCDQVKPFNFLNSFQARLQLHLSDADQLAIPKRGRPRKQYLIKPVGPFDKDMRKAAQHAFDRETGNSVEAETLMTYAEALAQYHLRPEAKFLNGDFFDKGRTERRHVVASQIIHIGKEANKWEERYFLGEVDDSEIEYGVAENDSSLDRRIRAICDEIGERQAAQNLGISRTALRRAMRLGTQALSRDIHGRLAPRVQPRAV